MTMKNIPKRKLKQKKAPKVVRWNTNKKDGWKRYKEITSNNIKLNNIANSDVAESGPNDMQNKIRNDQNKVKIFPEK